MRGQPSELVEFVETRSGRLYTVSEHDRAHWAQRDCADAACVEDHAVKLPYGYFWEFPAEIQRGEDDVTLVASTRRQDHNEYLLHYESEAWVLERMPAAPRGPWPVADGGLWVIVDDELWHRDPAGGWRDVELPVELSVELSVELGEPTLTAASRPELGELWICVATLGRTTFYATRASAQTPT
jgi:hypothetical protein